MSKLLVVFGATGQQGGSVIRSVQSDPKLSKEYKIRGIGRDANSASAKALIESGAEFAAANTDDLESMKKALEGAHTVFGVTTTTYDEEIFTRELARGKALADACVAVGASYLIFSTLAHVTDVSSGKYKVDSFTSKAEIKRYIRGLPIRSAFYAPGSFMQNFQDNMLPQPSQAGDGSYCMYNTPKPDAILPLVDITDTGKYVAAILSDPSKFEGKVLVGATKEYTWTEIAEILTKKTGKTITYQQIPVDVWKSFLPVPQLMKDQLADMFLFQEEFGYYGPGTSEAIAWTQAEAHGHLTTLEEYIDKAPLPLK